MHVNKNNKKAYYTSVLLAIRPRLTADEEETVKKNQNPEADATST